MIIERFTIKISIPITSIIIVIGTFFVCRYKVISGTSIILFLSEIIAIVMLCMVRRFEDIKCNKKIIWLHVMFITYRIFSSILSSGEIIESSRRIIIYELAPLIIMILFVQTVSFYDIIRLLKIMGYFNIILGFNEFVFKYNVFAGFINDAARISRYTFGTESYRVRTIFIHPIICGVFFTIIWFVFLFFPLKNKVYDYLIKLFLIICIIGTQARSSWISFALVNIILFVSMFCFNVKTTTKNNIIFFVFSMGVVLFMLIVFNSELVDLSKIVLSRWLDGMNRNSNASYNRIQMIKRGLHTFKNSSVLHMIMGAGNGHALSLLKAHSIRGWNAAVDNTYITILLDYGIIGILLLMYYFVIAFRSLCESSPYCKMAGAGLLSVLFSGMFYDLFNWFTTNFIISILVCIIAFKHENKKDTFLVTDLPLTSIDSELTISG